MKYLLLATILLLTGCSYPLGGDLVVESKVDIEMEKQLITPVFTKEIDVDIDREYNHFITPKGERGYIIVETKEENNIIYKRAYNPSKINIEERYYDWKIIQDNNLFPNDNTSSTPVK